VQFIAKGPFDTLSEYIDQDELDEN